MVKAIKNYHQYRGDAAFSSWLITIGSNLYRDQLRRKHRLEKSYDAILESKSLDGLLDIPGEVTFDLKPALLRLTLEKRIPLVLKYYYDFTYQEIANTLKIPIGTVRSRLFSALRELRAMLAENPNFDDKE